MMPAMTHSAMMSAGVENVNKVNERGCKEDVDHVLVRGRSVGRQRSIDRGDVMTAHKLLLRHWLLARSDWMEARVMEYAERNGYGHITIAMNRLFAQLGGRPLGLSELARRMSISRQAVYKLALEAERHGLVEFVDSELDGRVKLLRFSQKGWAMSEQAAQDFARIEAELATQIGDDNLTALKSILSMPWSTSERREE